MWPLFLPFFHVTYKVLHLLAEIEAASFKGSLEVTQNTGWAKGIHLWGVGKEQLRQHGSFTFAPD